MLLTKYLNKRRRQTPPPEHPSPACPTAQRSHLDPALVDYSPVRLKFNLSVAVSNLRRVVLRLETCGIDAFLFGMVCVNKQ